MSQIIVENLTKTYEVAERSKGLSGAVKGLFKRKIKIVNALSDVSFKIEPGELLGYIGPNGAGKSTTVKILSGILVPSSGKVEVMGRVPWKQRVEHVNVIGVVFGQRTQLWWDVPVIDSFELLRDIYSLKENDYKRTLEELIDVLALEEILNTPLRQLSLGQRMRCELAGSLLHKPKLLFLDEPTIGLDAVSKLKVRDFLKRHNRDYGTTIILTTHDMDDIEVLCNRVMVIGHGRKLFDGSMEALRQQFAPEKRLIVDFIGEAPILEDGFLDFGNGNMKADALQHSVSIEGQKVTISFNPNQTTTTEMITKISNLCTVSDLVVNNLPIEEIITRMYREVAL